MRRMLPTLNSDWLFNSGNLISWCISPTLYQFTQASIEQNITPGQERVRLETEIYNLNVAYGFGDYNFIPQFRWLRLEIRIQKKNSTSPPYTSPNPIKVPLVQSLS